MEASDDSTKKEIADCFKEHFKSYGFEKTRLSDVASYLGKSRRTIYNYFPGGKEEVYEFLIERYAQSVLRKITENLDPIAGYQAKLEALFVDMFRMNKLVRNKEDFKSVVPRDEIPAEGFQRAFKIKMQALLKGGSEAGEFITLKNDLAADMIYGMIRMALPYIFRKDGKKYEREIIQLIFRMILR